MLPELPLWNLDSAHGLTPAFHVSLTEHLLAVLRKLDRRRQRPDPIGNRHRGSGHPLSPATPPYMRVRVRRFRRLCVAIEQAR